MRRPSLIAALVAGLLLAACGHSGEDAAHTPTPPAHPYRSTTDLADWPTYHHTPDRAGHVAIGPSGKLQVGWSKHLEGAVYGEPLVIGDLLVVATEQNQVYGLDARTGRVEWQRDLGKPQPLSGLPCGNIDPLGVTGTPAYDAGTDRVLVAAETDGGAHTLWAIDPADGSAAWKRELDTQTARNRLAEQQRGALLVAGGRVITVFGGLAGDCDDYVGYAVSVPSSGRGATTSFAVPTAREAGIWATPGAVSHPNGTVLVASGNGAELHGTWDGSDSVIQLDPVTMQQRSVFAPSTWREDNERDLDLGSSSPVVVGDRVVIAGKRGQVYLLTLPLGGVGSQVDQSGGCTAFGGAAVAGDVAVMPCLGENQVRALRVGASSLTWSWTQDHLYGSPVIAGDRVYVADQATGDLVVLSLASGRRLSRQHAGPLPHFPSEVVSGDWVFVPTLDGITAFRGR